MPEFTLGGMYKVGSRAKKSARSNGNFQTLENTRISSSWCSNRTKDTPDFHERKMGGIPLREIDKLKGESLYLLTFAENDMMKEIKHNIS